MSLKAAMISDFWDEATGAFRAGAHSPEDLAARFGSPLYVFDARLLRRQLAAVRAALGPRVEVLFSLKANPNAAVARVLRLAGAGAETASAGEIHAALKAGFTPGQIQFAGPGKSAADLKLSVDQGIFALNLESEAEYEAVAALSRASGRRQGVAIRVNPEAPAPGSRMRMGGGRRKFGVDAAKVPALARRIHKEGACRLLGLHSYLGTQFFDAEAWGKDARAMLAFTREVEAACGTELSTVDFGGGFGLPMTEGDPTFDLAAAGESLQAAIAEDKRPERRYFVELGRYLTARAGVYLTRVLYLKDSQGGRYAVLDGGLHHHSAAAGVGSVLRRHPYPIVACKSPSDPDARTMTVCGPLCTPADEFAEACGLPELAPGDLLAVLSSGAYGLTFSNTLFLSHPTPAEVLIDGETAHLVREARGAEDVLRGQRLPEA